MKTVCVITGGGSGMGLAAAKCMPKEKIIVVTGRTMSKLEKAVEELTALGYEAYATTCDTSVREQVVKLAEYAASLGVIKNVIHSAGLSPAMAKPEQLMRVNALGTVYVNQEFSKRMPEGGVIVDVSSNSAYMLPDFLANKKTFALAEVNEELFLKKTLKLSKMIKDAYKSSGLAYGLSKKFVIWYAAKCAYEYGAKKIGERAFAECTSLKSVSLPGSLKTIGNNAFEGCTSLTEVTIPDRLDSLGEEAFKNCSSLEKLTVGKSVKTINKKAFFLLANTHLGQRI